MHIAYITETYPPEVNGVALTAERCVRHLRHNGHAVLLMRPRQAGEPARDTHTEWRTAGARIPMYPDLRMGLASAATLRHRFETFEPDIVHVATQGPLGRAAVHAAGELGVPVTTDFRTNFHVYCAHYGLGFASRLVVRYLRGFHNRSALTFVPCRRMVDELGALGFERVEALGRGVDARRFAPHQRSPELRQRWGAPDGVPVLLYVGRLAPEKNVPLALQAFAAVRRLHPRAQMVVVGDGPWRARLQAQYPMVHFAGVQRGDALATHYASADLFLFPSLSETFGNVTLEALASSLGVVAFDCAAAGELIRDGENGFLAAPGDAAGFVAAACRALSSPIELDAVRQRARRTALRADWEPVLHTFEQRLRQVAFAPEGLGPVDALRSLA